MTRLAPALAAWWLIVLSGPQGRAISPLVETLEECQATKAWVMRHRGDYDAICLPAARDVDRAKGLNADPR